jgi:hypothetical protein
LDCGLPDLPPEPVQVIHVKADVEIWLGEGEAEIAAGD